MTNANISARVDSVVRSEIDPHLQGRRTDNHGGRRTPIVTFAPGETGDLKAGASVDIFRPTAAADGAVEAARILVGRNGTKVPI